MTWSVLKPSSSPNDVRRAFLLSLGSRSGSTFYAAFLRLSRLGFAPDAHSHISGAIQGSRLRGSGQSTLLAQLGVCCPKARYYNAAFSGYFSTLLFYNSTC
jgi:hypothetical protein